MESANGIIFGITLIFAVISLIWLSHGSNKEEKVKRKQVNDILNFNIEEDKTYTIEAIEKASDMMTKIQLDYYKENQLTIILKGYVSEIKKVMTYIS